MKKTIRLSLLSSLLLTGLHAQTIEMDEVTVQAANRTNQNIKDLTDSVTIITAEDIQEARITTLSEALNRLGNIAMVSNGGPGQNSSFLLRGMDSRNTLVLIDGMRYNDVTGASGAQFSQIYLADIERIEIIKGAQSGIWGSEASAGVINIVTASAKEGLHVNANVQAGSFNSQEGSIQTSYKNELFDLVLGISRLKTDGFSAAQANQGTVDYLSNKESKGYEKDAYTNNTYNAKLGIYITDQDRFEASFRRIDSFTEYDGSSYDMASNSYHSIDAQNYESGFFGITRYFEEIDNRFYSAAYQHTDELNELSLQYNYSSFKRNISDFSGNVEEVALQDRINYMEDSFLRLGASYQDFEHEKNYGADFDEGYHNKAVYASNYNKLSLFDKIGTSILTQSLRFDDYSAFDSKVTWKAGFKQFVHEDIYLSANYGTAYNAPSLYQLYAPGFPDFFNPSVIIPVGNENLSPEKTRTAEISLGNDELTLTYFYNKVDNLIEYDPTFGYQNVSGRSRMKGLEFSYQDHFFEHLGLNLNYTYLDAKNADGEILRSRPKHQIDANVIYYITEGLDISLQGQYIGERYNDDDRKGAQTGKYTLLHTVVNYTINEHLTVYAKVDNLTDKYYQVRDGYATAERSFYAGVSASF